MHRALVGDFKQFGALLVRQVTVNCYLPFDLVEHSRPGFTLAAVISMDSRVAQVNLYSRKTPSFPSRIQSDGHRCAGTKGRQEEIIGPGSAIGAADGFRFVGHQPVTPGRNLLYESVSAPAHANDARFNCVRHSGISQ
jgi:hypothetical protein